MECFLKKTIGKPLLFLCKSPSIGMFSLGKIDGIILSDKNIKYNFFITPVSNNEELSIDGKGCIVLFAYPNILNFSLSDSYIVDFLMIQSAKNIDGIRINPYGNDLNCSNFNNSTKRCIVPKSHFDYEFSGYYYLYHLNHLRKYSIFYELPPIQIILPENKNIMLKITNENNQNIIVGEKETITFFTNYNDKGKNIFNDIDINKYISFNSTIIDTGRNKFNVTCKIWKTIDENIIIMCNFNNNNLFYTRNYIILNETTLNYGDYKIIISQESYIQVQKYFYNIPFLYYDKQIINIDNNDSYELKFKFESYNNDILYICGQSNNYAILDNCKIGTNELN